MEINPNHPVTKNLHDHWHKLVGVMMHKLGVREVRIVPEDMQFLLDTPMAVVAHDKADGLYVSLVTMEEGRKIAQDEQIPEPTEKKIARHEIFYFGAWMEAGHFLFTPERSHSQASRSCPFNEAQLDGSILLPHPESVGAGTLVHLRGWTLMSWWGNNPWDSRGAVNQSIIAKGDWSADEIWIAFQVFFPDLAKVLLRPTLV